MIRTTVLTLFLIGILLPQWGGVGAQPDRAQIAASLSDSGQSAHYIVFEKRADGSILPVYYRLVELKAPLVSLSNDQLNAVWDQPARNGQSLAAQLQDASGQTVFQQAVKEVPWLRGEFDGGSPGAEIDGHLFPLQEYSFVVRIPQIAGTSLVLKDSRLEPLAQFDLEQLAAQTEAIELASAPVVGQIGPSGPASNRVDLLIMGDGYTSAQAAKFNTDAANAAAGMFAASPYSVYKNYFNILTLFNASAQSGSDHPPYNATCSSGDITCCGDSLMQTDPLQGTFVTTAFDSRYCAWGMHRLMASSYSKVMAAAAAVPDFDDILLIVNDTTYGGSGGSYATISTHAEAVLLALHEHGHSFVNLADEYETPYPGYAPCSDLSGPKACEANVTDVTNRAQIKWKSWISDTTPIPTPFDSTYIDLVGLFQGARYLSTGMYRPGFSCLMRTLGGPYCQVPSQAFVLKLYNGGWGNPASGISMIEPGTLSPAGATFNLTHPASQILRATLLGPVGGPAPQVTWLENGVPIGGATGSSYTYTTSAAKTGLRQITLRVSDATTLVKPEMSGGALTDSFTWNIKVSILRKMYVPLLSKK